MEHKLISSIEEISVAYSERLTTIKWRLGSRATSEDVVAALRKDPMAVILNELREEYMRANSEAHSDGLNSKEATRFARTAVAAMQEAMLKAGRFEFLKKQFH